MKIKKIFICLISTMLLSSCDMFNEILSDLPSNIGQIVSGISRPGEDDNKESVSDEIYEIIEKYEKNVDSVYKVSDDEASENSINAIYKIEDEDKVPTAYAYDVDMVGYYPGIKCLVILDMEENIILGLEVYSHNETNGGTYGAVLLNSPEFAKQFERLPFDQVDTEVDFVAGSTARITLNGVKNGVNNIISFHKEHILGEEKIDVELTGVELDKLKKDNDYTIIDKTEWYKKEMENKVTAARYAGIFNKQEYGTNFLNYIEVNDLTKGETKIGYIMERKYNCEVEHGNRAWQKHKIVLLIDSTEAVEVIIVSSTDSLDSIGKEGLLDSWVDENVNGKSISTLTKLFENEIDYEAGATFTMKTLIEDIKYILDIHYIMFES